MPVAPIEPQTSDMTTKDSTAAMAVDNDNSVKAGTGQPQKAGTGQPACTTTSFGSQQPRKVPTASTRKLEISPPEIEQCAALGPFARYGAARGIGAACPLPVGAAYRSRRGAACPLPDGFESPLGHPGAMH